MASVLVSEGADEAVVLSIVKGSEAFYSQIENQLREHVLSGRLPAGVALPSIRDLTRELGCSTITTRRAYRDLESEGLVRSRQGRGTVVVESDVDQRIAQRDHFASSRLREAVSLSFRLGLSTKELRELYEATLKRELREDEAD